MRTLLFLTLVALSLNTAAQCSPEAVINPAGTVNICQGSSATLTASAGNIWNAKTNLTGVGRLYAVGFSIGAKGYIGTGLGASSVELADFWEYDPATDSWTQKANFGGGTRWGAAGFSIGSKGYIGTGRSGTTNYNDFWEYNPATNTWTARASFTGTARYQATGFSTTTMGYIATGWDGTTRVADMRKYNPATNTWSVATAFPGAARHSAVGFGIGTKGYLGTGSAAAANEDDFYEYNETTNSWQVRNKFPGPVRNSAAAFSIGNKGFVGIGINNTTYYGDFWEFNPVSNTWTARANYPGTGRRGAVGFSIGNNGYFVTGSNFLGTVTKNCWEYIPACTYNWSTGATTQSITASTDGSYTVSITSVTGCSATSLATQVTVNPLPAAAITVGGLTTFCAGGSVLLSSTQGNEWTQKMDFGGAGRREAVGFSIGSKGYIGTGNNGSTLYQDFWEYNPATNSWTQKANFGGGVRTAAVGFSIGTKGYVGTGAVNAATRSRDFWEYDPVTNTWTQMQFFGGTVRQYAVGFSIGSKGYIGTGNNASALSIYKDFWEYDPVTDTWTQKSDFGGTARYAAVGFSIGSKGYIGTGYDGSLKKDFWEYEPATDTWTQKLDFGGTARYYAVGFSIGSKGYIGTGNDGSGRKDFWEYEPVTDSWVQKLDFGGTTRISAAGFSIGSKGYAGIGLGGTGKDFWEYTPGNTFNWSTGVTTQSITASTAGSYTVTVTDALGCSATSSPILVTVNPLPAATITAGGPTAFCSGGNVNLAAPVNGLWAQKADFGGIARFTAVGFSIGTKGYIGTGYDGTPKKDFWEYDPATDSWTQKADFGGIARDFAVGFSIGTKGYIGTGYDGTTYKKDFWEYDPATNVWTQKADFGGTARGRSVGFSIGTKGYLGTGVDNLSLKKDFWEYDPATNVWAQKADFGGTARAEAVGFSIGTKGYVGTGLDNLSFKKDFWEYDPATNVWTQKADFGGTARRNAVGIFIGTKGYIGTGNDGTTKKDFWEYDPATNVWTQKANFGGTARALAVGFSIGIKGYIGTGNDGTYKKDFWEYSPDYNYTWSTGETTQSITASTAGNYTVTVADALGCYTTSSPVMVMVNPLPTATITPGGPTTFCVGGTVSLTAPASGVWIQKTDFSGSTRSAATGFSIATKGYIGTGWDASTISYRDFWEYDPATSAWTQKANFGGTARYYAVGLSIGTKGYIGTGYDGTVRYKDFWEYDPVANTWTAMAAFGGTARYYAVGFSIGTKGYIGTGWDAGGIKKDFWEYDPATNVWTQKADCSGIVRYGAVGFSIAAKGYIGTGTSNNDFWEYDPLSNIWVQKADFAGTPRIFASAFSIGNKGYIGAGNNGIDNTRFRDFWEYDPVTNAWTSKDEIGGTVRSSATSFSIGTKGYIGIGFDAGSVKNDFWEYDPAGTTYNYAWSNGAASQTITPDTSGTFTVAVTNSLGCAANSSPTVVTVNTTNTWAGGGTSNWNTAGNWSCGIVPNHPKVDAVIMNGASPMPVLTADVLLRSLALNGAATVDLNGRTLIINKNITGTGTLKGSASSNLTLKGSAGTVNFTPGSQVLKDLLLTDTASATLGTPLSITAGSAAGSVTVNNNAMLTTNGNLTLKSDVNGTARVGVLSGIIAGDVTVERYIHTGTSVGAHTKTWQFLATPTTGQTIRQAWQENGATPAGFGTIITGTGTGFDITTALPSLKFFNDAAVNWTAVTNTNNALQNKLGYMLFVRGDRTVTTSNGTPNNTVLRSKGILFQPTNPPLSVAVAANKFQTFGNPYASRIEFSKVRAISSGINDVFYVWDPKLAGNYNVGGYQTITGVAGYIPTVGTPPTGNPATDFYPAGVPSPFIESGQAVFVKGNGTGGNVNFNETVKATGSRLVNRPGNGNIDLADRGFIFASLFTSTGIIADGNIVAFEDGLGNEINTLDAMKIMNGGENFGINRNDSILAVEARNRVMKYDTIFYHLQNLKKLPYQFRFAPVNLRREGLHAYLIDRYNNSSTEVSMTDSSFISFSIMEDVRSQAANRFILVFKKAKQDPIKSNSPKDAQDLVSNRNNVISETKPEITSISIYPNPVVDKQIYIRFSNQPKGNYRIQLTNKQGQEVHASEFYLGETTSTLTIRVPEMLAPGSYQLCITAESGGKMVKNIVIR